MSEGDIKWNTGPGQITWIPEGYINITPAPQVIKSIYLIGSLRNPEITKVSKLIRDHFGIEVFDEWHSAGETADDSLRDHFREKGYSYADALNTYAARHIYDFDRHHLDRTDAAILVMPAGKSAHLELGYTIGKGKPGFILMDKEPDRYDLMYQFATKTFMNDNEMIEGLKKYVGPL